MAEDQQAPPTTVAVEAPAVDGQELMRRLALAEREIAQAEAQIDDAEERFRNAEWEASHFRGLYHDLLDRIGFALGEPRCLVEKLTHDQVEERVAALMRGAVQAHA